MRANRKKALAAKSMLLLDILFVSQITIRVAMAAQVLRCNPLTLTLTLTLNLNLNLNLKLTLRRN